jgi:hypothetical protein
MIKGIRFINDIRNISFDWIRVSSRLRLYGWFTITLCGLTMHVSWDLEGE